MGESEFFVQVTSIGPDRQIGWGTDLVDSLADREQQIQQAIRTGLSVVADGCHGIPVADGWEVQEITASFGLTLSAEGGVIFTKATAGTAFEITAKFTKTGELPIGDSQEIVDA